MSLALETQTLKSDQQMPGLASSSKNISRVVLVNELGERLLDTLVSPQSPNVSVKGGTKLALHRYAEARAEKLDRVLERVRSIIKGKILVGYHLIMKVADLGLKQDELVGTKEGAHIEIAKLFNTSPND